jgi:cold shock CspA family protein
MSETKASSPSKKFSGTCKWFNSKKGFGFIAPTGGGADVFVHQTVIHAEGFRSLGEGEQVEYNTETDSAGKIKAIDVTGPGGAYVKGAPKPNYSQPRRNYNDRNYNNDRNSGGNDRNTDRNDRNFDRQSGDQGGNYRGGGGAFRGGRGRGGGGGRGRGRGGYRNNNNYGNSGQNSGNYDNQNNDNQNQDS